MENILTAYDLLIIGGGAAGFFAACNAVKEQQVLILEKARQPLGKVRISGGGRCNLTHACFDPRRLVEYYPRGSAELLGCFTRFQPSDTMSWFEARGVPLKIEADGRVFPISNLSTSVVDCLLTSAQKAGAELRCQTSVTQIQALSAGSPARFQVDVHVRTPVKEAGTKTQEHVDKTLFAHNLLLASGGDSQGFTLAASLGHTIIPPVPSIFTFQIKDSRLEGLAGLSVPQARIRLFPLEGKVARFEQEGALLIAHWGVSGPGVLRCSAWGARWLHEQNYHAILEINWLHPASLDQALGALRGFKATIANQRRSILSRNPFPVLPLRLWQRLARSASIQETDQWANLSNAKLLQLAEALCAGRYEITGKGAFKEEFVTCGGVRLTEVDFKTMQSRLTPGLYFAGEVLDIDGLTGGFNFQSAWTTAYLAIQAINASIPSQGSS